MEFVKETKTSRFLDPLQGYAGATRQSQIRHDPLTGHTTRIMDFPISGLERVDLSTLVEKSRIFCPFCPEHINEVTPKFDPELLSRERYTCGEAVCVPNAFPVDENAAVTIMSRKHFIPLTGFTRGLLRDAFECCVHYLDDLMVGQKDMVYQSINWNYMPMAGGSIIHPHLQVTASSSPTNYYPNMLFALDRYSAEKHSDFWEDLALEEKSLGERFISDSSNFTWIMAFAPMGVFDVIGIMPHVSKPSDMLGEVIDDLAGALLDIFRYIDSLNMYSLNMSIYFLMNDGRFTPHVRLCPRISIPPLGTSQVNYLRMLHDECMTVMKPEDVCRGIREYWTH